MIGVLLVSILLLVGPIVSSVMWKPIPGAWLCYLIGGIGVLIAGVIMVITRLYQKAGAEEAIVRTGWGGPKVVVNGGILVVPVVHDSSRIPLCTIRKEVKRENGEALITKDKLRADIHAQFFIHVDPTTDAILNAARSFGNVGKNVETIKALVDDKLVSALRTVAAQKTLEDLNTDRKDFMAMVTEIVQNDLKHNGLSLETPTLSKLDQTSVTSLSDQNVFDAEGMKTIAQITQKQMTERNKLLRDGEQERMAQDVATAKKKLELALDQAQATATQEAAKAVATAEQSRASQEADIVSKKAVDLATIEKMLAIEVAARQKEAAIANADADRARAQADQAKAEALRETERQAITTVQVTATAEREKKQQVIAAEADAEKALVAVKKVAEGEAYRLTTTADGQKAAAEASAMAVTKAAKAAADAVEVKAEAAAKAKEAEARGDKAVQMVPVDVARKQVEVDASRVETVLKPTLQVRKELGDVAQQFELAQLRIQKDAEVRIATATATATILQKMEAQIVGTPETVGNLLEQIQRGMNVTALANSLVDHADPATMSAVREVISPFLALAQAGADRLAAKKPEGAGSANAGGENASK